MRCKYNYVAQRSNIPAYLQILLQLLVPLHLYQLLSSAQNRACLQHVGTLGIVLSTFVLWWAWGLLFARFIPRWHPYIV